MISRRCRQELKEDRKQALKRYEKQRRRNLLAEPGVLDFIIVLDNLKAGYNVPKIFRSAQAFGAREVHLINIGPFDPAPAKGAFRAVPARFFDSFDQSHSELQRLGYTIFTLEPNCTASLDTAALPTKSAFVLGHEERGISFNRRDYPDVRCLTIPHFGTVESLNVSVAASITMYEYSRSHGHRFGSTLTSHTCESETEAG